MYRIIPSLDIPALTQLIYAGYVDVAVRNQEDTDIAIPLALSGSKYEVGAKNVQKQFTPRILKSDLLSLYKSMCRGSFHAVDVIKLLYRSGIAVPKSDVIHALWSEMPFGGSIELPDNTVLTFADLKAVFKEHLRSAFKSSGLYCYPKKFVDYYWSLFKYVDPSKRPTGVRLKNLLVVSGCEADVVLTYTVFMGKLRLTYASAKLGTRMYDITTQCKGNRSIPNNMPNTITKKLEGLKVSVFGKFVFNKEARTRFDKSQLDAVMQTFMDLDIDSYQDTKLERFEFSHPIRAYLRRYEERYASAKTFIAEHAKNSIKRAKASKLVVEYDAKQAEYDKAVSEFRAKLRLEDPIKCLQFLAFDFVKSSTNLDRALKFTPVRAKYSSVIDKLKELEFDTMQVSFDNTPPSKNPYCFKGFMHRIEVDGVPMWIKES